MRRRDPSDPPDNKRLLIHAAQFLRDEFTVEDLVVAAWRAYPERFGLAGYRDRFPCALSVKSKVYGNDGVVARGWLAWVGTGEHELLRVTPAGLAAIARAA